MTTATASIFEPTTDAGRVLMARVEEAARDAARCTADGAERFAAMHRGQVVAYADAYAVVESDRATFRFVDRDEVASWAWLGAAEYHGRMMLADPTPTGQDVHRRAAMEAAERGEPSTI